MGQSHQRARHPPVRPAPTCLRLPLWLTQAGAVMPVRLGERQRPHHMTSTRLRRLRSLQTQRCRRPRLWPAPQRSARMVQPTPTAMAAPWHSPQRTPCKSQLPCPSRAPPHPCALRTPPQVRQSLCPAPPPPGQDRSASAFSTASATCPHHAWRLSQAPPPWQPGRASHPWSPAHWAHTSRSRRLTAGSRLQGCCPTGRLAACRAQTCTRSGGPRTRHPLTHKCARALLSSLTCQAWPRTMQRRPSLWGRIRVEGQMLQLSPHPNRPQRPQSAV